MMLNERIIMKTLPPSLQAYRRTAVFTEDTTPSALLKEHRTKEGVWGVLHVQSGFLEFHDSSTDSPVVLRAGETWVIEPATPHWVNLVGASSFFVEFWRRKNP